MLDIRLIREKADFVRHRLATRHGGDEQKIDEVLALDERRRKALAEVEQLKALRNRVSKDNRRLDGAKETCRSRGKKGGDARVGREDRRAGQGKRPGGGTTGRIDASIAQFAERKSEDRPIGGG